MDRTIKQERSHVIRDTFRELPGWQKFVVVFALLCASPALLLLAGLMAISLFPLALVGRFEGDMGPAPFTDDVAKRVHEQQLRTQRYYAH